MNDRGSRLRQVGSSREANPAIRIAELCGAAWHRVPALPVWVRGQALRWLAGRALSKIPPPYRLCLGSGRAPIAGWINVDYYFPADISLDLRFGWPIPDRSVEYIYSEHLVEHFSLEDALRIFRESWRVLMPGGRIRIATPDLADIVRDYQSDWRRHDWVNWDQYQWVDSGTRMVNTAVREWGHLYVWDFAELSSRLQQVGFGSVERVAIGESSVPALSGLETRADSGLVIEAVKEERP